MRGRRRNGEAGGGSGELSDSQLYTLLALSLAGTALVCIMVPKTVGEAGRNESKPCRQECPAGVAAAASRGPPAMQLPCNCLPFRCSLLSWSALAR